MGNIIFLGYLKKEQTFHKNGHQTHSSNSWKNVLATVQMLKNSFRCEFSSKDSKLLIKSETEKQMIS